MPYHHGNLRAALIDAALGLAAENGPDAVVLREAARLVGVSHNAAYRHFSDRDALLSAVGMRALAEFGALMARRIAEAAPGESDGPAALARFEASGRAYVEFAVTRPGLFRMVCGWSLDQAPQDAAAPTGLAPVGAEAVTVDGAPEGVDYHPYVQLSQRLDELVQVGLITPERRENAEIGAWSAVHGYATLLLDGPLRHASPAEREQGMSMVIRMVREGI